jgi:hypothetical protein
MNWKFMVVPLALLVSDPNCPSIELFRYGHSLLHVDDLPWA